MVQSGKRSLGVEQTRSCKTTVRFGERSSRQIHCNGAIEHNSKRSTCMLINRKDNTETRSPPSIHRY